MRRRVFIGGVLGGVLAGPLWGEERERHYRIATAGTGGTFYPVGVGIAALASLHLAREYGLTFDALTSQGSVENVRLLEEGRADFAILQALVGSMARHGTGCCRGRPVPSLRAVTALWKNVEQFVVRREAVTGTNIEALQEMSGRPFSMGGRESGSRISGETILDALGIDYRKFRLRYLGYDASVEGMIHGKIQGVNIPAGVPTAALSRLYSALGARAVRILDFDDAQLERVREAYPVWSRFVIPRGSYPGLERDVPTIAQPNFLACTRRVSAKTVYLLTRSIYENLPFLASIHRVTRSMMLERALEGLPVPLHPGALRFYRERGIVIPRHLIPEEERRRG